MSLIRRWFPRPRVLGAVTIFTLLSVLSLSVSGQSVSREYDTLIGHLTAIESERFAREGQIVNVNFEFQSDSSLSLSPAPLIEYITHLFPERGDNLVVEGLFFIRLTDEERAIATPHTLYNITRSVSTLTGIEYYSASRGRYRIFYEDSYVIDDPKSKIRQPDVLIPLDMPIPASDMQYLRQRDSSFGENVYRATYEYRDDIITLNIINLKTMFYTIIPLLQSEQLRTLFAILPTEDGIVFYGVSLAELSVGGLAGLEKRVANSFTNRLIAVFDWFANELTGSAKDDKE